MTPKDDIIDLLIYEDAIINFPLQKSITSKSPERKFGNKQIDHPNKENECASDASNHSL